MRVPQIKIHVIGRMRENEFLARAARNLEQICAILCKTTTWNYHIWAYDF